MLFMIRGALRRARQLVDNHAPVADQFARHFWVQDTNLRQRLSNHRQPVSPQGRWVIDELPRTGTRGVERDLSADRCAELRTTIDQLLAIHRGRVWSDHVGSDHRIYGTDRLGGPVRTLFEGAFVSSTLEADERRYEARDIALVAKPNSPRQSIPDHVAQLLVGARDAS